MTKEELLQKLRAIERGTPNKYSDEEDDHKDADFALLEYINDPEITAAFDSINKWYC